MPLFEIEQKFTFTLANALRLSRNTGFPPFKTLGEIHTQTIRDTYYDSHNKLSTAGIWLRRRHTSSHPTPSDHPDTDKWEAKQSAAAHGSSFLRSTMSETQDYDQIAWLVRARFGDASLVEDNFRLDAIARFETYRSWMLADDRFKVVLDETDFGHWVGEVELEAEDAERAHEEIEAFVWRYKWFFDTAKPKGKLTAYFEKFGYPTSDA